MINQYEDEDVLRAHRYAKVAAKFYTMLAESINFQVETYILTQPNEKPIDSGAGLDIGETYNPDTTIEEESII